MQNEILLSHSAANRRPLAARKIKRSNHRQYGWFPNLHIQYLQNNPATTEELGDVEGKTFKESVHQIPLELISSTILP